VEKKKVKKMEERIVKETKCPLCGGKGKIIFEDNDIIVIQCLDGHRRTTTKNKKSKIFP